jgi:hypothetical protein
MVYIDPPSPNHPHRETTEKDLEATLRIESVLMTNPPLGFEEIVEQYRIIEAELVQQAGDDQFDIIETKRRIAEWILTAASWRDQPFDVCQKAWNDLLALGFTSRYMKCNMACIYVDCCLETMQYEAGLAVVEPVIAELTDWLAVTNLEPEWRSDYENGVAGLKKRRDKLKAAEMDQQASS